MSSTSLQEEKQFQLCGQSLHFATVMCTALQIMAAATIGVLYSILLDASVITSILFSIHIFCTILAIIFLVFCLMKRKFGTFYEVLLHAHLLDILLMALTSLFAVMYLPLSFLQQPHSLGESMHYLFLLLSATGMLFLQFLQRNLVEAMLPFMEHSFL